MILLLLLWVLLHVFVHLIRVEIHLLPLLLIALVALVTSLRVLLVVWRRRRRVLQVLRQLVGVLNKNKENTVQRGYFSPFTT